MSKSCVEAFGTLQKNLESQGFEFPLEAFSEDESATLLREYLQFKESVESHPFLKSLGCISKPHLLSLWADKIVHHPPILDAVEAVLGPHLLVWSMDIFHRRAQGRGEQHEVAPRGLDWHQDSVYLGLEPLERIVRIWLALTPTTLENGTMRYLRGSHSRGQVQHADIQPGETQADAKGQKANVEIVEADVVPVLLSPGQFALHDIRTVHDSGVNQTAADRVAIAVTFIAGDIRALYPPDTAMLVRGRIDNEAFQLESRPTRDLTARNVEAFVNAMNIRVRLLEKVGVLELMT